MHVQAESTSFLNVKRKVGYDCDTRWDASDEDDEDDEEDETEPEQSDSQVKPVQRKFKRLRLDGHGNPSDDEVNHMLD